MTAVTTVPPLLGLQNLPRTPQFGNAMTHRDQTVRGAGLQAVGGNALAVIRDAQSEGGIADFDVKIRGLRLRMLENVGQRFLGNAETRRWRRRG